MTLGEEYVSPEVLAELLPGDEVVELDEPQVAGSLGYQATDKSKSKERMMFQGATQLGSCRNWFASYRLEVAMALFMCAVPLSLVFQEVVGFDSSYPTYALYLLAVLCLSDWNEVLKGRFVNQGSAYLVELLYAIALIIYGIAYGAPLFSSGYGLIYLIYAAVFALLLATNGRPIDSQVVSLILMIAMGVLAVVLILSMLSSGKSIDSLSFSALEQGSDRASLSGICALFFSGVMGMKSSVRNNILAAVFTPCALILMFACNRRGTYIYVVVSFALWIIKNVFGNAASKRRVHKGITSIAALTVCLAGLTLTIVIALVLNGSIDISFIADYIEHAYTSLTKALNTFLGVTGYSDMSSAIRVSYREAAIAELSSSNLVQTLLGHGYSRGFDFPILQSIVDMGVLGGSIWIALSVVVPVAMTVSTVGTSDYEASFQYILYFTNRLLCYVYSGTCYSLNSISCFILLYQLHSLKVQRSVDSNSIDYDAKYMRTSSLG